MTAYMNDSHGWIYGWLGFGAVEFTSGMRFALLQRREAWRKYYLVLHAMDFSRTQNARFLDFIPIYFSSFPLDN